MRALFLSLVIAMASLTDMMQPAVAGQGGIPKSSGIATEAPKGKNPLDTAINRLYWLESTGQISAEDAQKEFGKAMDAATPEQTRDYLESAQQEVRDAKKRK